MKRFEVKIDKSPGHGPAGTCWVWTASTNKDGYGSFGLDGRVQLAHRVAYQIHTGEIPDDLCVLHSCDNPPCVNPAHLSIGTQQDNMVQRSARGRTADGDRSGSRTHPESRPRGERNGNARLTERDVREILGWWATGDATQRQLARVYGASDGQIHKIVHRKRWKHVEVIG